MLSLLLNATARADYPDYIENVQNYKLTVDGAGINQSLRPFWNMYSTYSNTGSPNENHLASGPATFDEGSSITKAKAFNQDSGKMVSVYYTEWARYKTIVNSDAYSNVHPWMRQINFHEAPKWQNYFNPESVSHVQFGFVPICGDVNDETKYQLALCTVNPCSKLKIGLTSLQSMVIACKGSDPYSVVPFDIWGNFNGGTSNEGQFPHMDATKQAYPNLKYIASIGGWTLSKPFYYINTDDRVKTFANSVGKFAGMFRMFDGFDFDYEIPGGHGGADDGVAKVTYTAVDFNTADLVGEPLTGQLVQHAGNETEDKKWYVAMVKATREVLDVVGQKLNKTYELSVAVNCDVKAKMGFTDFVGLAQYVDGINMMTYDFSGAWANGSNPEDRNSWLTHQSNLYPREDGKTVSSVKEAYDYLTGQGVDSKKLAVGVAFYARGWSGVQRAAGHDVKMVNFTDDAGNAAQGPDYFDGFTTATGGCRGTVQDGVLDFQAVKYGEESGNCSYYYDECAQVPMLYCDSDKELFTYDNVRSTFAKAKFVIDNDMRGLFAWTWDQDDGTLINAMNEALGHEYKDPNQKKQFGPFPDRPATCSGGNVPTNTPPSPQPTQAPPTPPAFDVTEALKVYGGRCGIAKENDTINCPTGLTPASFQANKAWVDACNEWFPHLIADPTNGYAYDCATAIANFKANHPNGCDCGMSA